MAEFRKAFEKVIDIEGGFVDHPDDRGGATKFGISARAYPNLDIKNLTRDDAETIYKDDYWRPLYCSSISSQALAEALFSFGVNAGTARAVLTLQQAARLMGATQLTLDGIMGPKTLRTINKFTRKYGSALINAFRGFQFAFYLNIVKHNPSQHSFIRGWLRRLG